MADEIVSVFKRLLQFDTRNPPGQELECLKYIQGVLKSENLDSQIFETAQGRGNLVSRIKGSGAKAPLLITSHVDVVGVEESHWTHPPFSGIEAEGCIWGRGAIDMKNMTAYCIGTLLEIKRQGLKLKRDIIMAAVSDEETGGDFGMGHLVKNHPDLIQAEYALNEVGGYTLHLNGKRFYPIQVGEKGIFWIKVKFRGDPGHGSIPRKTNAHFKLANFLKSLETKNFPIHLTSSAEKFFDGVAEQLGTVQGFPMKLLKTPLAPRILSKKESTNEDSGKYAVLKAMVGHTSNPTGVESGKQHNVVPSEVSVKLDCRILPGFTSTDLISELEELTGMKLDYEVIKDAPGHEVSEKSELFEILKRSIESSDLGSHVVPTLTVGFTDAQHLQKLGVKCYGFTPVKIPPTLDFSKLYHGHNERIPIEGFLWGFETFKKAVVEYCC